MATKRISEMKKIKEERKTPIGTTTQIKMGMVREKLKSKIVKKRMTRVVVQSLQEVRDLSFNKRIVTDSI